ncbi:hypothetical protein JTE90_025456 [Oedothorax gibbosus]|uniref:Uncharacterized protein n=1 Tax=Oedothorax gibbosus TaxID=931172 RepID=A0AAV6U4G5_9ARAC|nr:hypothetical protein JTE90_025456 [Oedothorax gibbosus]
MLLCQLWIRCLGRRLWRKKLSVGLSSACIPPPNQKVKFSSKGPVLAFLEENEKAKQERRRERAEIRTHAMSSPLRSFFNSMYGTVKGLRPATQHAVKRKIFNIIMDSEEEQNVPYRDDDHIY